MNRGRDAVIIGANDYNKYYYNGLRLGESQRNEEHKPYDTTGLDSEQLTTERMPTETLSATTAQDIFEGITGVTNSRGSLVETTSYETPTEDSDSNNEERTTEVGVKESITTEGFSPPPVDTESWRPMTTTMISANYPKHKHKTNNNNNKIDNNYYNVYTNDNINENYDQTIDNGVNHDIEYIKGFSTITPEMYGSGNNPYSLPLVSEEIPVLAFSTPVNTEPNIGNYLKDYYYEPVPTSVADSIRHSDSLTTGRSHRHQQKQRNNSSKTPKDDNHSSRHNRYNRYNRYNNYHTNDTYLRPTFNRPLKANHPYPTSDMEPTRDALISNDENSYLDYQMMKNHEKNMNNIPKGRPLFALIGDETKNMAKIEQTFESMRNPKINARRPNNIIDHEELHFYNDDISGGVGGLSEPAKNRHRQRPYHLSDEEMPETQLPSVDVKPMKSKTKVSRFLILICWSMFSHQVKLAKLMYPRFISFFYLFKFSRPVLSQEVKSELKSELKSQKKMNSIPPFFTSAMKSSTIDGLFVNTSPMQSLLPLSHFPFQYKLPYGVRNRGVSTTTPMSVPFVDTQLTSADEPIAILHPNKVSDGLSVIELVHSLSTLIQMLTITTTSLLRNKLGEHLLGSNKLGKQFRLMFGKRNTVSGKQNSFKRRQRSTFRDKLKARSVRNKRRSLRDMFSLKTWFKLKSKLTN